jgi:hypothetical protein
VLAQQSGSEGYWIDNVYEKKKVKAKSWPFWERKLFEE